MIASGLSAPTDSATGIAAATAAPAVSYEIGQYFKGSGEEGSLKHMLAHGILGAAVAAAGGNNALSGGVAAMSAEAAAPVITRWLYGKSGSELSAEEKETVSAITRLLGTGTGALAGGQDAVGGAVSGSLSAGNAVENNWLSRKEVNAMVEYDRACKQGNQQACIKRDDLQRLDRERDLKVLAACKNPQSQQCRTLRFEAEKAQADLNVGALGKYAFWTEEAWDEAKMHAQNKEWGETDTLVLLAHGKTPEEIARNTQILNAASRFLADLSIAGTVRDFKEAETVKDLAMATILAMPGMKQADRLQYARDFRQAYQAAKDAGDLGAAKEVLELAKQAQRSPNNLTKLTQAEAKIQAKSVIKNLKIDSKIADQMTSRGWSRADIEALIQKGRTGTSVDKRSPAKTPDKLKRDDLADVYGDPKQHVVINRRTGEVTQVSDKTNPNWVTDGRIKFFNNSK